MITDELVRLCARVVVDHTLFKFIPIKMEMQRWEKLAELVLRTCEENKELELVELEALCLYKVEEARAAEGLLPHWLLVLLLKFIISLLIDLWLKSKGFPR